MFRGLQPVCLILFAVEAHPRYVLVLEANRDEFFARPSAPAAPWPDAKDIIGGRDLEKGGSWLALARGGRLAAVTNFRDATRKKTGVRSRGLLISDFVTSRERPQKFLEAVRDRADDYDGFNLIVAERGEVWHFNNVDRKIASVGA